MQAIAGGLLAQMFDMGAVGFGVRCAGFGEQDLARGDLSWRGIVARAHVFSQSRISSAQVSAIFTRLTWYSAFSSWPRSSCSCTSDRILVKARLVSPRIASTWRS